MLAALVTWLIVRNVDPKAQAPSIDAGNLQGANSLGVSRDSLDISELSEDLKSRVRSSLQPSSGKAAKRRELALGWGEVRDAASSPWDVVEVNPTKKVLSEPQRQEILDICRPFDQDLTNLSDLEIALHVQALEDLWERGRFETGSVAGSPGTESGQVQVRSSYSIFIGGQGIFFRIIDGEYPEYDSVLLKIREVRKARSLAVSTYIASL